MVDLEISDFACSKLYLAYNTLEQDRHIRIGLDEG